MGVVFLASLELGYLTPPVGMNLFPASLRSKQPLLEIWRTVRPFPAVFVVWTVVVIFFPALTVGVVGLIDG